MAVQSTYYDKWLILDNKYGEENNSQNLGNVQKHKENIHW